MNSLPGTLLTRLHHHVQSLKQPSETRPHHFRPAQASPCNSTILEFHMRHSSATIKRALTEDVVNKISRYYTDQDDYDRKALDRIASDCIYAITLKSDERRARAFKAPAAAYGRPQDDYNPRAYTDVSFEFSEVNYLINVSNAKIYGSNWRQLSRRAQLPVAGFFIDADGSRYWNDAPSINELKGIHIHGLIAYPESHIDRAHEVLPTIMKSLSARTPMLFNKYEIARFDPSRAMNLSDRSALENYVEYSAKGVAHLMDDRYRRGADMWTGELYRLYPNPVGGSYGYVSSRVAKPLGAV